LTFIASANPEATPAKNLLSSVTPPVPQAPAPRWITAVAARTSPPPYRQHGKLAGTAPQPPAAVPRAATPTAREMEWCGSPRACVACRSRFRRRHIRTRSP